MVPLPREPVQGARAMTQLELGRSWPLWIGRADSWGPPSHYRWNKRAELGGEDARSRRCVHRGRPAARALQKLQSPGEELPTPLTLVTCFWISSSSLLHLFAFLLPLKATAAHLQAGAPSSLSGSGGEGWLGQSIVF